MKTVTVLCCAKHSVYKSIPGADCFDKDRNAASFDGQNPVVAHPPCRLFGQLSQFVTLSECDACAEILLGVRCARFTQKNGGVLEQPANSSLFRIAGLPNPGDKTGPGWTMEIPQGWFGHRARKLSWFYFVGIKPKDLPPMPFAFDRYTGGGNGSNASVRLMGHKEREGTPKALAEWLIDVARRVEM